jgi:hypothetical protein
MLVQKKRSRINLFLINLMCLAIILKHALLGLYNVVQILQFDEQEICICEIYYDANNRNDSVNFR